MIELNVGRDDDQIVIISKNSANLVSKSVTDLLLFELLSEIKLMSHQLKTIGINVGRKK